MTHDSLVRMARNLRLIMLRISFLMQLLTQPSDPLAQNPPRSQDSLIPLQIVVIIIENYSAQQPHLQSACKPASLQPLSPRLAKVAGQPGR